MFWKKAEIFLVRLFFEPYGMKELKNSPIHRLLHFYLG